jgi:hypothetical protein
MDRIPATHILQESTRIKHGLTLRRKLREVGDVGAVIDGGEIEHQHGRNLALLDV